MSQVSENTIPPNTIPPRLIDEALKCVLASRRFRASARKRRFLQFIVLQTLAGQAHRIKAYTIAVDVFDRDADFDPLIDPVVRIHAGRIRHCLEQYYLNEGAADAVRITIPKGCYVPHFTLARAVERDGPALSDAPPPAVIDATLRTGNEGAGGRSPIPWPIPWRIGIVTGAILLLVMGLLLLAAWNIPSVPWPGRCGPASACSVTCETTGGDDPARSVASGAAVGRWDRRTVT